MLWWKRRDNLLELGWPKPEPQTMLTTANLTNVQSKAQVSKWEELSFKQKLKSSTIECKKVLVPHLMDLQKTTRPKQISLDEKSWSKSTKSGTHYSTSFLFWFLHSWMTSSSSSSSFRLTFSFSRSVSTWDVDMLLYFQNMLKQSSSQLRGVWFESSVKDGFQSGECDDCDDEGDDGDVVDDDENRNIAAVVGHKKWSHTRTFDRVGFKQRRE